VMTPPLSGLLQREGAPDPLAEPDPDHLPHCRAGHALPPGDRAPPGGERSRWPTPAARSGLAPQRVSPTGLRRQDDERLRRVPEQGVNDEPASASCPRPQRREADGR
jgi:hypothetical protein